jgi:hypothetical protein
MRRFRFGPSGRCAGLVPVLTQLELQTMSAKAIDAFCIIGVLAISGCGVGMESSESDTGQITRKIVAANAESDQNLHLIARTFLDETSEVAEFYEPAPGRIVFSMAGSPSQGTSLTPRDVAGKSIDEVWQRVSHGAPMPDALAKVAQASPTRMAIAKFAPGTGGSSPSTAPASSPSGHHRDLTNGYCGTQWLSDFSCPGSGHSYQWCDYDQWGTDNAWVNNGTDYYFNVCSEIGSVTLNMSGGGINGSWTVLQNTYRWYSGSDPSIYCWNWYFTSGCQGYLSESGSVTPNGSAAYNFEGYLDWP